MKIFATLSVLSSLLVLLVGCGSSSTTAPTDVIYTLQGSQTTMLASRNHGGAIYSAVLNGFQYVNSTVGGVATWNGWPWEGNLFQTAYAYENSGYDNPTEAGSNCDWGLPCASPILAVTQVGKNYSTQVNPLYFTLTTATSPKVSPDIIAKSVTIDYNGVVNLIRHDISVEWKETGHTEVSMQGLVLYGNPALTSLYSWDGKTLKSVSYVSAEPIQPITGATIPFIMATPDGANAVGLYGPAVSYSFASQSGASAASIISTNLMFSPAPQPGTSSAWTVYYVFGSLAEVQAKLAAIMLSVPRASIARK